MPDYFSPHLIEKNGLEELIRATNVVSTVRPRTTTTLVLKQPGVSFSLDIMHKGSNSNISVSGKKMRKAMGSFVQNLHRAQINWQEWLVVFRASLPSNQKIFQFSHGRA
jgi:hypothetical protein